MDQTNNWISSKSTTRPTHSVTKGTTHLKLEPSNREEVQAALDREHGWYTSFTLCRSYTSLPTSRVSQSSSIIITQKKSSSIIPRCLETGQEGREGGRDGFHPFSFALKNHFKLKLNCFSNQTCFQIISRFWKSKLAFWDKILELYFYKNF